MHTLPTRRASAVQRTTPVPPPLQLVGPLARLLPKAMLLGQRFTPAARADVISAYPPCMTLRTTTPENLLHMLCAHLAETLYRLIGALGHKRCKAGSAADLAVRRAQLVDGAVSLARFMRTWWGCGGCCTAITPPACCSCS